MATTKHDVFTAQEQHLSMLAKALAHPARIAILKTLAERGTCVCGQVVEVLPLAQATVSQHLKELKEAGLIKGEVDGPRMCYCLDYDALALAAQEFSTLFVALGSTRPQTNCC